MKIPLPVHSYSQAAAVLGSQRLVNCFAQQAPPDGKSAVQLLRSPGIVSAATLARPGRGLTRFQGNLYAVAGNSLYRVDADGSVTACGNVNGRDICSFADNSQQLVVCSAVTSFVYNGNLLTPITDPDFNKGVQCAALDSYILFRGEGGQFFCSDLADATSYDALNFATAEGAPDDLVGLIVDHRQVMLFGTDSIELWSNQGGTGFPFARDANGFLEIGCAAGYSVAKADNSVYWLASDLTVRRLDGLTPVRVSQHGVEQAIRSYGAAVKDARAFGFTLDGHISYVLNVAGHTWVHDATTKEWHEKESYGLTRWRPCATAFCYGRNYVQDYETGNVGFLDPDTFTDWDNVQRMAWTYGSVYKNNDLQSHAGFELVCEVGVGTTTGQGTHPKVTLEYSDDDGVTWTTMPTRSLGRLGSRRGQVTWERLGSSRKRVYRNSCSDPVRMAVADTQLTLS